jgi:hypothetical protein
VKKVSTVQFAIFAMGLHTNDLLQWSGPAALWIELGVGSIVSYDGLEVVGS